MPPSGICTLHFRHTRQLLQLRQPTCVNASETFWLHALGAECFVTAFLVPSETFWLHALGAECFVTAFLVPSETFWLYALGAECFVLMPTWCPVKPFAGRPLTAAVSLWAGRQQGQRPGGHDLQV